ncbi:hypothetical protein HID58_065090 [Brassica napus]|uniref:ferredoxin--NADP(+) reductase n=1 Tax=Brassica napus TaxID=3708 RepID=A0ABQ7ZBU4_BRANA|nr:hypothetical protein HID58_065090 [Brassica napus]
MYTKDVFSYFMANSTTLKRFSTLRLDQMEETNYVILNELFALARKSITCEVVVQPHVAVVSVSIGNERSLTRSVFKSHSFRLCLLDFLISSEFDLKPSFACVVSLFILQHNNSISFNTKSCSSSFALTQKTSKPGAPHNVRLYSIASTRYGDFFDGKTVSLCVRRAVYYDPETGKEDPSKNGVCSNFLCDSKPGDKIQITDPSGKVMLLPENDPNATHIMIATGT